MKKQIAFAGFALAASQLAAGVYVGASGGYLLDAEEEFFTARLGFDVGEATSIRHGLEVEVGFVSESDSAGDYSADIDVIPVFANYRATFTGKSVEPFIGAGAGFANIDLEGSGGEVSVSDSDTPFALQAFGGVEFNVASGFSLHATVRYLWIDDAEFFGYDVEIGDDVALEVGATFRF